MEAIDLTYQRWMQVHPHYRSIIRGVPHVAAFDNSELVLMPVRIERPSAQPRPDSRPAAGQLTFPAA